MPYPRAKHEKMTLARITVFRGGLAERRSEIKHVPRYNSKLARVSCLKAMGVFCILDAEVQVLLMIYMVAFIIEHIWISYQEWIFGLIKKSN
jgi:hypothetical protein